MRVKKLLRLLALLSFIFLASIIPFPLHFYRKDNLPKHKIEQFDKKKEVMEEEDYQAFS